MKTFTLLLCLILGTHLYSQSIKSEGIFAASENYSGTDAMISWTIGDFQTRTYATDNLVLTQGFLQGNLAITHVESIKENTSIEMDVFPNPVKDYLNVKYVAQKEMAITFHLYSLSGGLLYSKVTKATSYNEQLNFRQFDSGTYVLKAFSEDGSFIKTFKLIYQN